jgi:hypothetical protein
MYAASRAFKMLYKQHTKVNILVYEVCSSGTKWKFHAVNSQWKSEAISDSLRGLKIKLEKIPSLLFQLRVKFVLRLV